MRLKISKHQITLNYNELSNKVLQNVCGPIDDNLLDIEENFNVTISRLGSKIDIKGDFKAVNMAKKAIKLLINTFEKNMHTQDEEVRQSLSNIEQEFGPSLKIKTKKSTIVPSTKNQELFLENLVKCSINFAIGPAGCGKTFLAVAHACQEFEKGSIEKIIFVRPAVEAGEKLGFLPGDLSEKVDPYLQPLYDAANTFLGPLLTNKLIEQNQIEICPLAFMRGRTLKNACVILDEAQNTTIDQMKMFLTRMGYGSKLIITGDVSQTDLKPNIQSGLLHASKCLKNIDDIKFNYLENKDIVRHKLVRSILKAYDKSSS